MTYDNQNLISDKLTLSLGLLQQLQQKPPLFTPGESLFWDDSHISEQMLRAHLDPTTDAASYQPETIDRPINWLIDTLELGSGSTVLDLGCGPGLYSARLARLGIQVAGVDFSRCSIDYAKRYAHEHNLDISYRYQDYLTLEDVEQYDVVLLISGDFCPLSPEQRAKLLDAIHRALRDGGFFVLDVSTPEYGKDQRIGKNWYVAGSSFWKPGPHLVLEQRFDYPEQAVNLNQYTVIELEGTLSVYRNWLQTFTPDSITSELEQGGFLINSLGGDLTGKPYRRSSEWIGVVAQKSQNHQIVSEEWEN